MWDGEFSSTKRRQIRLGARKIKLANVMTLVPRRSDKNPRKAGQGHVSGYDNILAYRKMVGKRPLQHLARISDLRLEHSS